MLWLSPSVGHAFRSLGGLRSKHWREVAVKNWELAPAETRENPVPLCIDGQLEKARNLDHGWRVDTLPGLLSPTITQKATTAHRLEKVDIIVTSLYSGRMHHFVSDQRPPLFCRRPIERIPAAVLTSVYSGNKWFGHFIMDTCTMTLMASDVANDRQMELVSTPLVTDKFGQRGRYLTVLGIETRTVYRACCDELVIIDPLGLNSYHRSKVEELRRRLRMHINSRNHSHRVYLRRGTSGEVRTPINEPEIESILTEYGFVTLEPERMRLDDLLASLLGATLVVGVEGSQLVHAVLSAAENATMLTLQSPHRFVVPLKMYTEEIGLRWGFLIGKPRDGRDWVLDADELRWTLDLALETQR